MLVGRSSELELIRAFVRGESQPRTPVLLFSGEPGVGKTALLDVAAEIGASNGRAVARATALEYEVDLAFGALNQILHPLLHGISALDDFHRSAIAVICGLQQGPPPTQLTASAAMLALVQHVARETPLLFVIDDVPWLDVESAMTFAYVARRMGSTDARFVAAARSELDNVFVRSGFEAHILEPLSDESSDALLVDRFPRLGASVRRRIRDVARGNPLALVDLPAALEHVPGSPQDTLPLTSRLLALYAQRVSDLPPETRDLLLVIVLAGAENSVAIENRLPPPEGRVDLAPAERAGIVHLNPRSGRLEFRHPLIRSAVFELSTSDERRHAHALLAEAFRDEPQRRAWHLGQSAGAPDEEIADLLERVSNELIHAGNSTRATAAMLRAAELSPARQDRARRIARAAYLGSLVTGELHAIPRLLEEARSDSASPPSLDAVIAAAFHLLNGEGDASTAQKLLIAALDACPGSLGSEDETAMEALQTLVFVDFYAGRSELWAETRRQFARVKPDLPETLALLDGAFADAARADPPIIHRLDSAIDVLPFTSDPVQITRVSTAGAYLDRLHRARDPLWRVIYDGRQGGALAKEIEALFLLANDDYFTGEWDELERLTEEGLRLCDELGYTLTSAPGRFLQALVDAARGRDAAADGAAEKLLVWAAPRRLYSLASYSSHIRCMQAIAAGRFETAYRHAASVSPAGTLPPFVSQAVWVAFDLVEAAVRSGRVAEAIAHVRVLEDAGVAELSPRLRLLVGAARALVLPAVEARDEFQGALATPESERWVFDRARVHLVFGEQLRRMHAAVEAREQLASAIDLFRLLDASPWLDRANRELRAAGGAGQTAEQLTPQEAAVAQLAATGLTNKEIAEQLFLSPRTVSTHLSRIYAKLGIASRAALRDALLRQPADASR